MNNLFGSLRGTGEVTATGKTLDEALKNCVEQAQEQGGDKPLMWLEVGTVDAEGNRHPQRRIEFLPE